MNRDMYLKVRNSIVRAMNSQEFTREFGKGDAIKASVDTMIKSLDIMAKGGRTGVGQNMRETVYKGTMVMLEFVTYHKLSNFLTSFAFMYADLLTIFNKELAYNMDFDIMADAIRSIVRSHLTLMEAIDVMKNLLDRAERYLRLEPPAYGISRHFVEKIWKELEEGEEVGDYPNKAVEFTVRKKPMKKNKCGKR